MKKILFVIDSIGCGGAERALISLLNQLNYSEYDVDLIYFCHENEYFHAQIPKKVRILEASLPTQIALSSGNFVINNLWHLKYFPLIIDRIWIWGWGKLNDKNYFRRRVRDWKKLRRFIPQLAGNYDAAIGFIETYSVYYTIDKVIAKKYIVWQRTDYHGTNCCADWDRPYFQKADKICVLSEAMKKNFLQEFPDLKQKVIVFPNVIDHAGILSKADEIQEFDDSYEGIRIISSGTLRKVKGYDVSIRACKRLAEGGYKFKWYILGSGEQRDELLNDIRRLGLQEHFILLGNKRNPYTYIKQSDIFVQCSYREGFSTTVYEAKCLQKPIVITDAPGMENQIENEVNGLIVPRGNDQKVAEAIVRLIDSETLRKQFSEELKRFVQSIDDDTQEKLELFDRITS